LKDKDGERRVSIDPVDSAFSVFLSFLSFRFSKIAELPRVTSLMSLKAMLGLIRKGETIMAKRTMKSAVWGLIVTLLTSVWLMGFVTEVGAETMKVQVSNAVMKAERSPVGDVEGHALIFLMREGSMRLENGELGSMKALVVNKTIPTGTLFVGYLVFTFADSSTIVMSLQEGKFSFAPEGEWAGPQEAKGELLSGSGRFKGIKGTMSMTGKVRKPASGEIAGSVENDFILTYTLPPK
jgi:hypothetical protein